MKITNMLLATGVLLFFVPLCGAQDPASQEPASAESPHSVSASVSLATEYMYRGITQTSQDPAIQGSFDYSFDPLGFYAGTWASNVEFDGVRDDSSIEIDFYAGFAGEFSNGIGWDVGGLYYFYPDQDSEGSTEYDFWEAYGSLSYTLEQVMFKPSLTGFVAWSPDFYGSDDDSVYLDGTVEFSLPYEFGLAFEYAWLSVDGDETTGVAGSAFTDGFDYTHYRIGLSREIVGLNLDLSWYDDVTGNCEEYGGEDTCTAVVFSVSADMDLF